MDIRQDIRKIAYTASKNTEASDGKGDRMPEYKQMSAREERLTYDELFMGMAALTAMRSADPNTQVGAVIVSSPAHGNRVLSLGYNGMPQVSGDDRDHIPENSFPWGTSEDPLFDKHNFVLHAEQNALASYHGEHQALKGSRIYVTLFPCSVCARLIAQNGIREVIYLGDKYHDTPDAAVSRKILDTCKIPYRAFMPNSPEHATLELKIGGNL